MKGLEIKRYGRGHQVFYKGEKCELIGSGVSRKVYKTPDEKLVLKLEPEESEYSLQSYNEYRNFLRLKKKGINVSGKQCIDTVFLIFIIRMLFLMK